MINTEFANPELIRCKAKRASSLLLTKTKEKIEASSIKMKAARKALGEIQALLTEVR